jgi:hypothetical protein
LERFPGKETKHGDAAIIMETFSGVPVLVDLWGAEDEFAADANVLFDKSVRKYFVLKIS